MERFVQAATGGRDLSQWVNQQWLIAASFFFFAAVYAASFFTSLFSETYKQLSRREQVFWHLSVVRAVFGIFAAVAGLWAALHELELHRDVVMAKTQNSYFMIVVTCGFFILECFALYTSNIVFRFFDANLAIHHSLALVGYLAVLYYDCNHFFAAVGLMLEMSTPASALCWILLKSKLAHTTVWKVNQWVLIHLFHCRSIVETYLFYKTYVEWERVWSVMPMGIFVLLYGQLTLICFWLTPFWTYKKTWQYFNPVDWNHAKSGKQAATNGSVPTSGPASLGDTKKDQ